MFSPHHYFDPRCSLLIFTNSALVLDVQSKANSSPIFLNREGWTKYSFNLWEDFSRDLYDGVTYGDNMFGLSRIIRIAFVVRSKYPVEDCRIYLDRIELEGYEKK